MEVPKRLKGKVAVVTAATAGIGLGIAERLAQEGAKVLICSRYLPADNQSLLDSQRVCLDLQQQQFDLCSSAADFRSLQQQQ